MKAIQFFLLLFIGASFIFADELSDELEASLQATTNQSMHEANRLSALGALNHQNGNFQLALKYYDQSIQLMKGLKNKNDLSYANTLFLSAIVSHRLGNSCDALTRVKSAIIIYKKHSPNTMKIAKEEADTVFRPNCGIAGI